ncbi:hypothetical protein KJ797_02820 [Patescibacteria group bacterium]|nr:hypothetical protein [Patescibacteria group bacterium]MBU2007905.1 hypothetical protein [Patescibacteria group bacterium]MBU2264241.1 hypothetical protein [Patescibacteria group bacterium]
MNERISWFQKELAKQASCRLTDEKIVEIKEGGKGGEGEKEKWEDGSGLSAGVHFGAGHY